MSDLRLVGLTAVGPMLWGTNYLATSQLLPPGVPLAAGAIRALPAGLLLLLLVAVRDRTVVLPRGSWWWRAALLGTLNIGLFFVLFFVAAYRLPGGVAAVFGALGPFLVAGLAYPLLGERPTGRVLAAAGIGLAGVALLVLRSSTWLDPIGLAAAAGGMATMSVATVLGRRWGLPKASSRGTAVLALTSWQLIAGGLLLLPIAFVVEGPPAITSWTNVAGFAYIALIGTGVAHFLWFGGVGGLAPVRVSLLSLLSPVVATGLGWAVLGQSLSPAQMLGAAAVLGSVMLGAMSMRVDLARLGLRPYRSIGSKPGCPAG